MEESELIDENEIYKGFEKVISRKDKVIVLYSGIWSFIDKLKFKKNLGKKILDIVENIVTPKRTLILPSFSANAFLKKKIFDIKSTIDNKNGILSNEALRRSHYYRTPQPLHSYLVFGKKKDEIKLNHYYQNLRHH